MGTKDSAEEVVVAVVMIVACLHGLEGAVSTYLAHSFRLSRLFYHHHSEYFHLSLSRFTPSTTHLH